jgi:hypothetical protein
MHICTVSDNSCRNKYFICRSISLLYSVHTVRYILYFMECQHLMVPRLRMAPRLFPFILALFLMYAKLLLSSFSSMGHMFYDPNSISYHQHTCWSYVMDDPSPPIACLLSPCTILDDLCPPIACLPPACLQMYWMTLCMCVGRPMSP